MTTQAKFIFVPIAEINYDRFIVKNPSSYQTKDGMSIVESLIKYSNDEGEECDLYVSYPPQRTFAPNESYDLGLAKEDQTPDKIKGYQIMYPITSLTSVNNPTEEEQGTIDGMNTMRRKCIDRIDEIKEQEDLWDEIPASARSLLNVTESGFKPLFEHPKKEEEKNGKKRKVFDTSKSQRAYWKLNTVGRGDKLKMKTTYYGPGDVKTNPISLKDREGKSLQGFVQPINLVKSIYYGSHGTLPYGASLKQVNVEATFTPIAVDRGMPQRMAPVNMAQPVEEDDDTQSVVIMKKPKVVSEDNEEAVFEKESTPLEKLKKAASVAQVVPVQAAPAKKVEVAEVKKAAPTAKASTTTTVAEAKKESASQIAPAKKTPAKKSSAAAKKQVAQEEEMTLSD